MKSHTQILLIFLFCVALLITIGFIFIYSSSSAYALERHNDALFYLKKQLLGLVLGVVLGMILCFIPLKFLKNVSPYLFLVSLCTTAATLLPYIGVSIHGSHRWLSLAGFSFQPSEFLKIFFILYCAYFLEKKQFTLHAIKHYLQLLIVISMTAGILLIQPDFGQMVTLSVTAVLLFFLAQVPITYLTITAIPVLPILGLLVYLKPYRFHRILIFQDPWKDPQGAGFQIIQSLIAIGSGGLTGLGIAQSKQKFFYLPMHHTDFIFSIIAEETGFIGVILLIGVFALFMFTGFKLASYMKEQFSFLCIAGIISLITLQTIINIGVACALLPTKGIGLPFISYGASSLLAHVCMIGIICNCFKSNFRRHF
ncbi:MAG: putative lipid II flippase FtsW [Candidatus Babeliaceae bacterium]|nr:putative lipid II flippase FtsW [Candidatus Babeliaceae bacterium]